MDNKKCFGKYVFEDVECMMCDQSHYCIQYGDQKREEERIRKYPECEGCVDCRYCKSIPRCIGIYIDCDNNDCDCKMQCEEVAFRKKKKGNIVVIKDVLCCGYGYKNTLLKANEKYEYAITSGCNDNEYIYILKDGSIRKIFDINQYTWKKYIVLK